MTHIVNDPRKHRNLLVTDMDKSVLLYRYTRGSHAYGTAIETSDEDTGGVYCADMNRLIGTRLHYSDQVQDPSHDTVFYELEKYIRLLGASNPNVLESLFVDEQFIQYMHPAFKILRDNREKFLTKRCFNSFGGYAITQIQKARGLNKKVTMVKPEYKTPLDFCYTKYKQGSTNIQNWLAYRNLDKDYIGCVNIPNMGEMIALYYDWQRFLNDNADVPFVEIFRLVYMVDISGRQPTLVKTMKESKAAGTWTDEDEASYQEELKMLRWEAFVQFVYQHYNLNTPHAFQDWIDYQKTVDRNYKGMIKTLPDGTLATCFRFSSVAVDDAPICEMYYNMNGYSEHCKQFKEYQIWERNRNPVRYKENCEKNYDSKNMMHAFRLLTMAIEVAEGKGFNVNRQGRDREFLLSIRRHEYSYDELIAQLEDLKARFDKACAESQLPDSIDEELMDELCIKIREAFWSSKETSE